MAFVRVNPDAIRRYLPEYHLYIETNPDLAGELTNKEAGYIAEVLTLAGLQQGKNVMVDGSLRRADWYREYFARLRSEFPDLRIAIIHVVAPREAIFQRASVSEAQLLYLFDVAAVPRGSSVSYSGPLICSQPQERALHTGRIVPRELLDKTIEQVPRSVAELAPLVDYHIELMNDPSSPDIEIVTPGETWETFTSHWIQ